MRLAPLALAALLAGCYDLPDYEAGVKRAYVGEAAIAAAGEGAAATLVGLEAARAGAEAIIPLGEVYFETDKAALSPEGLVLIAELAVALRERPGRVIVAAGSADPRGAARYNLALSQRRAETVALRLLSEGVATPRLVYAGLGEPRPSPEGMGPAELQADRRVDIVVIAEE